jgi:hypothetical protein
MADHANAPANAPVSWQPRPILRWLVFTFTGLMGIETGAGLFTTKVVFPLWASSPEAAIGWLPSSRYYLEEGDFFMFVSPTLLLVSIATLIAGWRAALPLRRWLRIATIVFIAIDIWTMAYFIPFQGWVKGEAGTKYATAQLASMLTTFVYLNYVRQVLLVLTLGVALHALGLLYKMSRRPHPV